MVTLGSIALKRLRGQALRTCRWSLGRFGLPINSFAFLYSCSAIVFVCFPVTVPVEAVSMNWTIVILAEVMTIALDYYFVHGRRVY